MSSTRLLVPALLAGLVSFAATPVARVISTGAVEVDGISAPSQNFVPVSVGGEVASQTATAVVQFNDGSKITLRPNSKLRIEGDAAHPSVKMVRGSAVYDVLPTSNVQIATSARAAAANVAAANATAADAARGAAMASMVHSQGIVTPVAAVPTSSNGVSQLAAGGAFTGSFEQGAPGAIPAITTPGGLRLNLAPIFNANGDITGYTIASASQTVVLPNGSSTTVPLTGGLLGLAITVIPQQGSNIEFNFFNGSQNIDNNTAATTINNAISSAVSSAGLPAGTTVPVVKTQSGNNFSGTAP